MPDSIIIIWVSYKRRFHEIKRHFVDKSALSIPTVVARRSPIDGSKSHYRIVSKVRYLLWVVLIVFLQRFPHGAHQRPFLQDLNAWKVVHYLIQKRRAGSGKPHQKDGRGFVGLHRGVGRVGIHVLNRGPRVDDPTD